MDISEKLMKFIVVFVIIFIVLFLFVFILDQITGAGIVRRMVCSTLFWVPFGNVYIHLTGGCEAIPV